MGKRIIISTSWEKLNFLDRERESKALKQIKDNKFIGFDHSVKTFVALKSDTDIILIQDKASIQQLNEKGLYFNNETDYFLHHTTNGLGNGLNNIFRDGQIADGLHEKDKKWKYKPVFDIILDGENEKLNRILTVLGFTEKQINEKDILEAKLNLLHLCLTPNGAKEVTKIQNYNLIQKTVEGVTTDDKSNSIVKYLSEQTDCFREDYVAALTKLRDALLKDY